jgi:hypothetical protein
MEYVRLRRNDAETIMPRAVQAAYLSNRAKSCEERALRAPLRAEDVAMT